MSASPDSSPDPHPETTATPRRAVRRRVKRLVLVVFGAAIVIAQLASHRSDQTRRSELLGRGFAVGLEQIDPPGLARASRAADPFETALILGESLLTHTLRGERSGPLHADERRANLAALPARLALIEELGRECLRVRPSNPEAATLLGAAALLARSGRGDTRIYRERERWRTPLTHAIALAPGRIQALILLAAGELGSWFALSPSERDNAAGVLRTALADPTGFDLLIGPWLAANGHDPAALALVPDRASAWLRVRETLGQQADWEGWSTAEDRRNAARRREATANLDLAEAMLAAGDIPRARRQYATVFAQLEPSLDDRDLFVRALGQSPAGTLAAQQVPVEGWLTMATDAWLAGRVPLPPEVVARLAAARPDLPLRSRAIAALIAGDLSRAETLAQRAEEDWSEAWAPYVVSRSRRLLESGDARGALAGLGELHRSWRTSPATLAVITAARAAAGPLAAGSDAALPAGWWDQLNFQPTTRDHGPSSGWGQVWPATAWRFRGPRAQLLLIADQPTTTLSIDLMAAPAGGGVVSVLLDGREFRHVVPRRQAATSERSEWAELHTLVDLEPGLHLVEVIPTAGGVFRPGTLATAGPPAMTIPVSDAGRS